MILCVVTGRYDPTYETAKKLERDGSAFVMAVGGSLTGYRFSGVLISSDAMSRRDDPHYRRWFEEDLSLKLPLERA